ncbi:MAG: homoserine acetyltransferase, partial [Blastocatellia bacterium]
RMRAAGVSVEYGELQSDHGHDGFLAEPQQLAPFMRRTLDPPVDAFAQALPSHRPPHPLTPGNPL